MSKRIVCFGELLLRLSAPGRQLLLQSPQLEVYVGGAEANVAVSLARFGHRVAMVSAVPDSPLGRACIGELRRHGVRTDSVRFANGRMGLYFLETGAIDRPSEVLYDRAHSAFALASADAVDWDTEFARADAFHLSGITPALGKTAAAAAIRAIKAARARDLFVSFDCNFRAKLWQAWKGDAPSILREIVARADVVFAEHRDIELILGLDLSSVPAHERNARAAQAAFEAFPQVVRLFSTTRAQRSVDDHQLGAVMYSRSGMLAAEAYAVTPIVDRIGAGDAFAAGVLHGLRTQMSEPDALQFGLAAACLKHSVPGDFNLLGADAVKALMTRSALDVKR